MRAVMTSASSSRPTDSSQRGDSGSLARMNQMIAAPSEPATNIHRQPLMPYGAIGTSRRPRNPAAGTPMNPMVYAHAV